jgi:hypothetical protein
VQHSCISLGLKDSNHREQPEGRNTESTKTTLNYLCVLCATLLYFSEAKRHFPQSTARGRNTENTKTSLNYLCDLCATLLYFFAVKGHNKKSRKEETHRTQRRILTISVSTAQHSCISLRLKGTINKKSRNKETRRTQRGLLIYLLICKSLFSTKRKNSLKDTS